MEYCDLSTSLRYQRLLDRSGISDFNLKTFIQTYYDKYEDFPYLDEIPGVNSENFIKQALQVKDELGEDYMYISNDRLFEYTNKSNVKEAMAELNKESDLEITLINLGETSLIKIQHRPSEYDMSIKPDPNFIPESEINLSKTQSILTNRLNRFKNKFGITINTITNYDIDKFPVDVSTAQAFVYDGQIYINLDLAKPDAAIHELLHIFMGAVRYTDPDLYTQLIQSIQDINGIDKRLQLYNRTMNDAMEEIFVEEFAKYVTGQPSIFDKQSPKLLHKLMYQVIRNVDSFIQGRFSVKSLDTQFVFNSTIQKLAEITQSDIINNGYESSLQLAEIHRMVANTKERLLKEGELIQDCK